MRTAPRPTVLVIVGCVVALLVASCNAILGNVPGRPYSKDASLEAQVCPTGQKLCLGVCVDALNPAFGCGADTCSTCNLPRTAGYGCKGTG